MRLNLIQVLQGFLVLSTLLQQHVLVEKGLAVLESSLLVLRKGILIGLHDSQSLLVVVHEMGSHSEGNPSITLTGFEVEDSEAGFTVSSKISCLNLIENSQYIFQITKTQ